MGIIANALTLMVGGLLGSLLKSKITLQYGGVFGITVMLISAVGIIENMFNINAGALESSELFVVVFALIIGWSFGEWLRIDDRLSGLAKAKTVQLNAFIDATVFFGIGGLQICGPILLAITGDSSQLYLKSVIDFPFALMFGAIYGRCVMLSAIPVAAVQLAIAGIARAAGDFIGGAMLGQLCSVGYLILFFGGFNLVCDTKHKIKNINMIPAILVIILIEIVSVLLSKLAM